MKRYGLLSIFAAVFVLAANSQVRWLEETHNFGAFNESVGQVTCDMKFINESVKPVIITQVNVTCGCTSPSYERSPIAPGDTGVVTLAYNAEGRPGRFEKKVYVDINTTPGRYTLYIKGSVIGSPSTVEQRYPAKFGSMRMAASMVPFGEVVKGHTKTYFLELYNASADTVMPKWADVPAFLSAGVPRDTVFPGENIAYTFLLNSDKVPEYGLTVDSVRLVTKTLSGATEQFSIPVMVMVNEDFSRLLPGQLKNAPMISADESTLNLGSLTRDGQPGTGTFTISNSGKDPLVIRRVYSADPGVTATISQSKIKKGKEAVVTVTVDPRECVGDVVNARVTVISNDPVEPLLNVKVVGEIKP